LCLLFIVIVPIQWYGNCCYKIALRSWIVWITISLRLYWRKICLKRKRKRLLCLLEKHLFLIHSNNLRELCYLWIDGIDSVISNLFCSSPVSLTCVFPKTIFLFVKTVYVINYWLEFFARSQTLIFLVNFCQLIWSNFFLDFF